MGAVNCRNCHCKKEEKEQSELNFEGMKKRNNDGVIKLNPKFTQYFKNGKKVISGEEVIQEETNKKEITNDTQITQKDLNSDERIKIDINENYSFRNKINENNNNNDNDTNKNDESNSSELIGQIEIEDDKDLKEQFDNYIKENNKNEILKTGKNSNIDLNDDINLNKKENVKEENENDFNIESNNDILKENNEENNFIIINNEQANQQNIQENINENKSEGNNEKKDNITEENIKEENNIINDNKENNNSNGNNINNNTNKINIENKKEEDNINKNNNIENNNNNIINKEKNKNNKENNRNEVKKPEKKNENVIRKEEKITLNPKNPNLDFNNIKFENTESFQIENSFINHIPNFEIGKIQFGIENKEKEILNDEEQKLFEEAQKNLEQFYPPEQKEVKVIEKKLKKISLKSILPQDKLKQISQDDNTIIYHGELKKLINYEISVTKPQMYSARFCIMNSKVFKYYKSKEQFLKNLKPLCIVPLTQITKINFAKIKKTSKKIDHIILCNKLGIKKKEKDSIFGHMFDDVEAKSYLQSPETDESLLIFTCDNEDFMYRWYVLLQYFTEKFKSKIKDNEDE